MLRSLKSVIVAVICSGLVFWLLTHVSRYIFPRPENIAMDDKAALSQFLIDQPISEQVFLTLSFAISGFFGAYIAARMSELYRFWIGMIGGGFILMVCVSIFLYIPYNKSYAGLTIITLLISIVAGAFTGRQSMPKA